MISAEKILPSRKLPWPSSFNTKSPRVNVHISSTPVTDEGFIQKAVESIIFAHIFTPLPTEIRVEGKGYVLCGSKHGDNLFTNHEITFFFLVPFI